MVLLGYGYTTEFKKSSKNFIKTIPPSFTTEQGDFEKPSLGFSGAPFGYLALVKVARKKRYHKL